MWYLTETLTVCALNQNGKADEKYIADILQIQLHIKYGVQGRTKSGRGGMGLQNYPGVQGPPRHLVGCID